MRIPAFPLAATASVRGSILLATLAFAALYGSPARAAQLIMNSDDKIFASQFDYSEMEPVCVTTQTVDRIFTNEDPSVFFSPAWQQSQYGGICPAASEMLAFNDAVCEQQPDHDPPRHFCSAIACCGTPPPIPVCDQDAAGGLPAAAIDIEPATDMVETRGLLSDLYPNQDTTTDAFHANLECDSSIGEPDLPAEVDEPPSAEELAAEQLLSEYEQTEGATLVANTSIAMSPTAPWPREPDPDVCRMSDPSLVNGPSSIVPCASMLDPDQPFDGRDVIYVHGLGVEHLKNWIGNYTPAHSLWPEDSDEFMQPGGYFRTYAENYWRDHIREHLSDPTAGSYIEGWQWWAGDSEPRYRSKQNRYLIVAWSSNQRLQYAQNAFLIQVAAAINDGTNVVTPAEFPQNQHRPFCANGCVVISHSTGGLLVSTTLGQLARGDWGSQLQHLPDHIRAHVAFDGAISGSRIATVTVGIGGAVMGAASPGHGLLCRAIDDVFGGNGQFCDSINSTFLQNTVLLDLIPAVAQTKWGPVLSDSPVPTLTVAGGHPVGNHYGLTKWLLPGIDDGVVSANSACGNPNPVFPFAMAPSGVVVPLRKAFDLGDVTTRAVKNFLSQKNLRQGAHPGGLRYLAGMCTPYLTVSGMRLPVDDALGGTQWDTRARWPNHFSMIQGIADHSYDGGSDDSNRWPSALGQPASTSRHYLNMLGWNNNEESSAVTNAGIYHRYADGSYLVKPEFAKSVEIVKGRYIKFRLFRKTRKIWLWKRTYERLNHWEQRQDSHYVYEFVARH
ncbi:MAG: hypothetical protein IPP82_02750 [Xanthomonadales bacterium]|nr:hypothetical protein [Xanthomonadales bacterium]